MYMVHKKRFLLCAGTAEPVDYDGFRNFPEDKGVLRYITGAVQETNKKRPQGDGSCPVSIKKPWRNFMLCVRVYMTTSREGM